jgi:hypothetical protein
VSAPPPLPRGSSTDGERLRAYYFFAPSMDAHLHLYHSWVVAARGEGIDARLLTLLPGEIFRAQRAAVRHWRRQEAVEIRRIWRRRYADAVFAFFRRAAGTGPLVVHLRKQPVAPLVALREATGGRLRFLVELEGDHESEADFLRSHPYRQGFYDETLAHYARAAAHQRALVTAADHVVVASPQLREALVERHPDLDLEGRTSVLPTGASPVGAGLDRAARTRLRALYGWEKRTVVTYAGNLFYSWQSLGSCARAFRAIQREVAPDALLCVLTRPGDFPIARDFARRAGIPDGDLVLLHVAPHEMGAHLSASDLGLLLRPDHPAMWRASAGKFGDYVLAGLPVLLSRGAGEHARIAERDGVLPVVEDIECEREILAATRRLVAFRWDDRQRLAAWGRSHVATQAHAKAYAQLLRALAERGRSGAARPSS